MGKILVLTVGGAHQPILESLKQGPDFTHFLCSADTEKAKGSYIQVAGEGNVIKSDSSLKAPDLPSIAALANLSQDKFQVHTIEHFDDLNDCYLKALEIIQTVHRCYPEARVLADYSGGTKSMTAGLAAAALDDGQCEIVVVTGQRTDLTRVRDSTQFVRPAQVQDAQVTRRMDRAAELVARFDYAGASKVLEEAARRFASDETIGRLRQWINLCRAFDVWDRFDHKGADKLLKHCGGIANEYKAFLAVMTGDKGHGFELVEDLLLNAERRAAQERYDDAVGRLYRATELTAQVCLKQHHKIETSRVDISLVPEGIRDRVEQKRDERGDIKIGLLLAWDLLASFPDDALGNNYLAQRNMLLDFLQVRNNSLFAHGRRPVTREDYYSYAPKMKSFVQKAVDLALETLGKRRIANLSQLPTKLE